MKYSPNTIKVDFASYRHYWRGSKKIGKTTLFRDILISEYGDPKFGLLISPGNETGYKALDGLYAQEAPSWKEFVGTVDDLVKNKTENEFKLVAIDTVDELVAIAINRAMDVHRERSGKEAKSLNEILGGYGAGRKFVTKLLNDQINRLERAGYGIVFIGHTKLRDIKERGRDDAYQTVTSNLEEGYDSIFADKADILATFYLEKVVKDGMLEEKVRYIHFRDDGFIDCGSRLEGMPDKVEMSAKNYLEAFRHGVELSKRNDKSVEEIRVGEIRNRETSAAEYVKQENAEPQKSKKELVDEIKGLLPKASEEVKKELRSKMLALFKEYHSSGNPANIDDAETLETLLVRINKLIEGE